MNHCTKTIWPCPSMKSFVPKLYSVAIQFSDFKFYVFGNISWGGIAPYSQTVGSLLRTPWPAKPAIKRIHLETYFFLAESAIQICWFHNNIIWQLSPNSFVWESDFWTLKTSFISMVNSSSAVVEQSTHNPDFRGSNPGVDGTGREETAGKV